MKVLAEEINPSSGWLARGLHNQDHTRAEDGDVAVVALERCHGGLVGTGDGVERLAVLHPVPNDAGFFRIRTFVVSFGRTGGALIGHGRLGFGLSL